MNEQLSNMYFVKFGQRTGQFLIIMEYDKTKNIYGVLGLPESETIYLTKKDLDEGIDKKVLDFVEKLPEDIFSTCKDEYKYRLNNK